MTITDRINAFATRVATEIKSLWASVRTVPTNKKTGTSYTLSLADVGGCVEMNNASANTVVIPPVSSVNIPIGSMILVRWYGVGQTTIVAGDVVVKIRNPHGTTKIYARYGCASLHHRAQNEWCIEGNLAES